MAAENYWADLLAPTLREREAAGRITIEPSSIPFFDQLARRYPTAGSKIDWSNVPGAIGNVALETDNEIDRHLSLVYVISRRHALGGATDYAADGLTEFVIKGELDELITLLPSLLKVPQHHYLAASDGSWCFCFAFEGHTDFGFSPSG